ncbi:CopG family transcriptional regulator [Nocardia panacis]|uniref:CopG family transcriptional regulator n=1 Tax=Nocardia panacis TaxID=2340916 RepID=UPI0019394ABA|nr:CopG family transcriptional regulator [Nocardia panacis]
MSLTRTTVYVDSDDLAIIKDAAAHGDFNEAEIIRLGVHLAALRVQRRKQPLELPTFSSGDPTSADRAEEYLAADFGNDPHKPPLSGEDARPWDRLQ